LEEDFVDLPEILPVVKAGEAVDLDETDPVVPAALSSPNSASSSSPSATSHCWLGRFESVLSSDEVRDVKLGTLIVAFGVVSPDVSTAASPVVVSSVLGVPSLSEVERGPEQSCILAEHEDLLSSMSDWP
jgi:hypothetical protein